MDLPTNPTVWGIIVLIINGLLLWLREAIKHRTWSKNGADLKEIKTSVETVDGKITSLNGKVDSLGGKVDCLDGKVGDTKVKIAEVKGVVTSQAKHCKQTVERFDKTIGDQNQTIIGLAKNSGKR